MTIASVSVRGQNYDINVTEDQGKKTVSESAITTAISGMTDPEREKAFKDLIKAGVTIKLDSGAEVSSQEEFDAALGHLQSISGEDMTVDIAALMEVFVKCNQSLRNAARERRSAELNAQADSLRAAGAEMKIAADKRYDAGICQGVMGITAGAVQVGAGAVQFGMAGMALGEGKKAADFDSRAKSLRSDAKELELLGGDKQTSLHWERQATELELKSSNHSGLSTALSNKTQAIGQIGGGISGMISSGGAIGHTSLTHDADMAEVKRTGLETDAKMHETNVQHANEMMQNTQEAIRDMKEKIAAIQQAQSETTRGIARNI